MVLAATGTISLPVAASRDRGNLNADRSAPRTINAFTPSPETTNQVFVATNGNRLADYPDVHRNELKRVRCCLTFFPQYQQSNDADAGAGNDQTNHHEFERPRKE